MAIRWPLINDSLKLLKHIDLMYEIKDCEEGFLITTVYN